MCRTHVTRACAATSLYVQALRPVSGGVPGAPSPAQQLLELGDALLTVNGARRRCIVVQGVQRGACRAAWDAGATGSEGVQARHDEGVLARGIHASHMHPTPALHLLL